MNAIDAIAAERKRQIEVEGFTHEHDDEYAGGELSDAAACYAIGMRLHVWPWRTDWWKPKDRRSDLIRAGALIIAEIERLDRAGDKP